MITWCDDIAIFSFITFFMHREIVLTVHSPIASRIRIITVFREFFSFNTSLGSNESQKEF
jgi:hypothetical protein